jgi:hypothetical protein
MADDQQQVWAKAKSRVKTEWAQLKKRERIRDYIKLC